MASHRDIAACLALVSLALPTTAQAGGFYIKEQSAQALGRAYAGVSAFAPDASAVYFNPAALTQLDGFTATSNVYGLIFESEAENGGSLRTVPGLEDPIPVGGTTGGNPFDPIIPLGNFYLAYPADDDGLWVGLGVNAPFGLNLKYNSDFFGRYDSLKSLLFNINVQPTVAWNVTPNFSIGAGLNIQYADVTLTNAIPNVDPTLPDGIFRVEGDDWSLGYNVGIHAVFGNLQVGAHYRSGVDYVLNGRVIIRGVFDPLTALNQTSLGSAPLELPDLFSAGFVYGVPETGFRVLFDMTWFDWSDFESIDITTATGLEFGAPQNYRNSYSFALGAEYDWNDRWTVRLGTQYDETPTRDGFRTTRIPDGDRLWVTAGLTYQLTERYTVDFSYAHIFVQPEPLNLSESFFEGTPAEVDVLTIGRNSGDGDIVALGITAKF